MAGRRGKAEGNRRRNGNITSYGDLVVWQKSMEFVTNVYTITKDFLKEEQYALTSQIRRSAVSVPSNSAEGYGRNSTL